MSFAGKVLRRTWKDIEKQPAFVKAKFVNLIRDLQPCVVGTALIALESILAKVLSDTKY